MSRNGDGIVKAAMRFLENYSALWGLLDSVPQNPLVDRDRYSKPQTYICAVIEESTLVEEKAVETLSKFLST